MAKTEYDWQETARIMEANGWVRVGDATYTTPEEAAQNTPERRQQIKKSYDYYFSLLDEEEKRGTNDSWAVA